MKKLMLLTAAFALSATMAMALTADDLVAAYQAQGFTKIEVTTGVTQIKVEAVKGKTKLEVIYDSTTGTILKQDRGWAGRPDRTPGVELSTSTQDFFGGAHDGADDNGMGNDDGPNHDQNDDHGGEGSDDGPNHDAGDDHGGGHDNSGHGNDHDGNDD